MQIGGNPQLHPRTRRSIERSSSEDRVHASETQPVPSLSALKPLLRPIDASESRGWHHGSTVRVKAEEWDRASRPVVQLTLGLQLLVVF